MRTATSRLLAAFLAAALPAGAALAAGAADAIMVHDPYVREVPPGTPNTGAFMMLMNMGDKDVKLVKAASPVAKVAELHTHINDNGIMKMRPVAAIDVKAKGDATLKPGGLHVMLIDLKRPLKEGDKVAITLGFDDGSSKQIEAPVRKPGEESGAMGGMENMHH
jgi:periplasmic copper chaperone A